MNPLYVKIALSVFRKAMAAGGVSGIAVSDNELVQAVGAVVTAVSLVWGIVEQVRDRRRLLTAAASPGPTTVERVESLVKHGEAPSVSTPKDEIPQLKSDRMIL